MMPEIAYLGISLSQIGELTKNYWTVLKTVNIVVYQLRKLGIFKKGLSAEKCIKFYKL